MSYESPKYWLFDRRHPIYTAGWSIILFRNREEEEERLRELEEDYEDDDFYSKKKKKKDNKKSSNEWTEDDYNLLVKLLNKYPGNCFFQKRFIDYVMITSLLRNAKTIAKNNVKVVHRIDGTE